MDRLGTHSIARAGRSRSDRKGVLGLTIPKGIALWQSFKTKDKFRKKPWVSDLWIGDQRVRKYFKTETEAKAKAHDAKEQVSINETGKLLKHKNLSLYKDTQIVEEYRDEEAVKHKGPKYELSRIRTILKHDICKKYPGIVNEYHGLEYRNNRLEAVSPPSVRREMSIFVSITFREFIDAHMAYVMGGAFLCTAGIMIHAYFSGRQRQKQGVSSSENRPC